MGKCGKIVQLHSIPHFSSARLRKNQPSWQSTQAVEIAFVDQGYTGDIPAEVAKEHGIQLEVIKLLQAKRGFVLLPRRWVVERSFAWTTVFDGWCVITSDFLPLLLAFI
jgi:transposase